MSKAPVAEASTAAAMTVGTAQTADVLETVAPVAQFWAEAGGVAVEVVAVET